MENNKMRAILAEIGREPRICELPKEAKQQHTEIQDLLAGNFGATEFLNIGNGVSLFVLTNDLSIPLRLKANRRFPGQDNDTIIFGNAIFIAAYNDEAKADLNGTIDMPEHICTMFIEQIKVHFAACRGDEQPRSEDEIYYDETPEGENIAYKWQEIEKPDQLGRFIEAGRVKVYEPWPDQEIMCINERYFKKIFIYTDKTPLS